MQSGDEGAPSEVKAEINVTPLVDVVLVLLIIFMVVTPQLEAGATVKLPSAQHPDPVETAKAAKVATLSLDKEGALFLEKQPLKLDQLARELTQLRAAHPGLTVAIRADHAVDYAKVRALIRTCQELELPGAHLQVADQGKS
jgi:biopolymer transport protein TolR